MTSKSLQAAQIIHSITWQSNGMAERAVQICKNILKKSDSEENVIRSLMAYRTTPTKDMQYSPAQLLQNRALRTELPMHNNKFQPKLCVEVDQQLEHKQHKSRIYYNRNARTRPTNFETNQQVLFKNNNKWQLGHITEKHSTPRSFIIQSDGRSYRRNTKHMKKYNENKNNSQNINNESMEQQDYRKVTRSGKHY